MPLGPHLLLELDVHESGRIDTLYGEQAREAYRQLRTHGERLAAAYPNISGSWGDDHGRYCATYEHALDLFTYAVDMLLDLPVFNMVPGRNPIAGCLITLRGAIVAGDFDPNLIDSAEYMSCINEATKLSKQVQPCELALSPLAAQKMPERMKAYVQDLIPAAVMRLDALEFFVRMRPGVRLVGMR